MKTLCYLALSAGCFVAVTSVPASAQTAAPQSVARKTVKKGTPVAPLTIPASAVKQADGDYRYVDAKGTAWIYRNTPFGVSRATEASVQAQGVAVSQNAGQRVSQNQLQSNVGPSPDRDEKVTAIANGETIQFTRPTPFGATRWTKSKSALTPDEQKIWDREQSKRNQ